MKSYNPKTCCECGGWTIDLSGRPDPDNWGNMIPLEDNKIMRLCSICGKNWFEKWKEPK